MPGAVQDARNIHTYLTTVLHVPYSHIRVCDDNSSTTRKSILEALAHHLLDNGNIAKDNTVIVFFAGQGSSYDARQFWRDGVGSIEALCPSDRDPHNPESPPDISHRELFLLLEDIGKETASSIVLILDCCYSAGMHRRDLSTELTVRAAGPNRNSGVQKMLEAAIGNLHGRHSDYSSALLLDWVPRLDFVMLAACHEQEKAFGGPNGGLFTSALITKLKGIGDSLTYRGLIASIGPLPSRNEPRQTPVASGTQIDDIVFNPPRSRRDRALSPF